MFYAKFERFSCLLAIGYGLVICEVNVVWWLKNAQKAKMKLLHLLCS